MVSTSRGSAADRPLYVRLIERMPAPLHADLYESAERLLAVRTPKQAQHALEDEYEHVLRRVLPHVIERPLLQSRSAAAAFAASFATLAATAEEADEILTLVSAGTLTAPGTSVVVAVGLLSAVAETYAAASVRVHQLRANGVVVDSDELASDVRVAVFGARNNKGLLVARRMVDGAAGRIGTRWAVGAIPFVGIGYAAIDSARSVTRVLQLPVPSAPDREQ